MNQSEYEDLFVEEHPIIPTKGRFFSQGNHQRSFINEQWFYYGEAGDEYTLYKDVIVRETEETLWVDMYADDAPMLAHPVPVKKADHTRLYPVQDLFPHPMSDSEAVERLRQHFIDIERSTTKEIPSF